MFLLAVADGVGGNNGGSTASEMAIDMLRSSFCENASLNVCLEVIHAALLNRSSIDPELSGMATTLTAVVIENGVLRGAHAGDSRAYILRGNGLKQLTEDHTEVARLLAEGKLTKDEAWDYPRKNILYSALGIHKDLIIQTFEFHLEVGDRILLMTDGVHGKVPKKIILEASRRNTQFQPFCSAILSEVIDQSPNDNFTLVGVQLDTL